MAKPGSDRDGAMVDKQAGKKSKDKISPFTKTPKLDRSDLLGKEGKPKSSMKRKLSFTASPPRGEERDSDTDKEGPDKKKVKKEAGGKKSASANLLFGYPLSERKQMALLMQMTARDNSPDSTPSHPSPAATLQRKLPSSTASRQRDKVNKRNERGETPLHMAAIRGDAKQVKELISLGADVNVKDFAGWTPLHEACNLGYYDVAKVLLAAGAEVNTQGLDDDTPLHDASSSGHKNILKLLLRHGGNAFQANKRGERPVDVADSLELERLLKGEAAPSDSDDSSSESEDPPSVNPSSLDDDNMDDSDADNKDPDDKRAAAAAKASSSTSGLDEYEFKDEEEEEEDDEEEEEDVLSKALAPRREGKPHGEEAGAERERGRNHFAAKQDGGGSGKPKKPRVPPRARCCGGTDSSSDETENPPPERRSSPTCSHGPPDPRGRKENPVLALGAEQPRDKGKVKRKSKSLSKNKENQEDGKENSKALGLFSSAVAAGNDAGDSRRGDDDSFKMSFSPKDDASVHLFHLASSAKSPKLNHQGAADNKPPTPLKQENAKACGGGAEMDGAKYNHYGAEQDYCTTEGSSSKGCKHKEKSKHHQKDGEEDAASPYKDGGVANSVDGGGGEGAMRKTNKDGKVVKKHKLKHKEKDKHRRDYDVQDRNRHRPPKDAARRDGQNRNLEFDREFWKENFFKSDENDEPSPPPPAAVKKEPDDAGSSTPKHAAVADAASSPAKEERAARDKHTGAKEKRPREEQRERDRGAKKERREERGKEARPAAEPDAGRTPEEATPKDEPEERPVAEQDQPDTYEKVPARERYDKRLPDRKEPEKPERRHPDKDRKVKAEHTADLPQNLPERLREKERERGGGGASHSPADRSHREAEKPRSASATKKNEENRRTKEKRGGGGEEQHREKDRPKDRKLPERPERPREKDCDKKRREKTKEASASSASSSNLKLLLEERRGYAPAPARAREDATTAARTPEKERRDRDADRYREREKERYRERSQQGKAAKPKPAEADGTPADRAKSKASPATPRGDPRPKEKRLVNDDLMQTSFERMLSLKDQEIEQWHRKHLEKIKQKERERLKQQRPSPAPPAAAVDPARVRSRDRAARPEPPPCAAAAGKELLRSRSSEGPETPGREKAAARDATGNRTLSLDSRSLSVLGGGRLPAGAENSLSRSPRPEGERSSDLMSRSVSMVSVASSDDSCRATTPTPTRPPEYDSDLTLEAGGDSQLPSFLQTSSVLSLHTATRSPVVHDRDGAPLPDAAAAQCGRTPLPSRLASPYLRAILDEDANSPSVVEGKPFDVLPKAPPGGEEPADFPRAAPPPEVSADPEETPPCGRGSTPPAVPPSARPDVDAVVIPESAASVPVPTVLPPPLSDAKDSTRPLPAGQSQAGIPQLAGVEPTGPLTSDPPVTLEVRCLPTDVPDGASKELPSVETPLLTAACLTAPPPAPSSNARAPAPTFRQPSEAPLSTEAPQAEAGLDLREKNPLDGAGAENLAVPESVWGSSRTERTSSPVPSSSAAAGRTPSEEEPGQGRTGAEPADPREDADDGTRFRPAGDATDIRADPPTDKSEHVRPSSSSASSSASPERRAEETADAPQSAEITTGDAETPTTMTPAAADKESSSMETAPDMAEPPCPEPMEASSSVDDGPEPTPGAGESGQSAAAAPPPVDMSGGSASGSSSPQSGDRDSDSSGAKAKAARSPSDEDADMQVAAHPRKRKMPRASPPSSSSSSSSSSSQACLTAPPDKDTPQQSLAAIVDSVKLEEIEPYQTERANPYYDFLHIRRKIEEKRKFLLSVIPQPPQFYDEYVTFNGSYLIDGNPLSKLCIPTITPPPSLPEQLKEMFKQQEVVRMKLRLQHSIEREKLIVSNEQEILRVHYRAARTLANQTLPFSACTVLLDAEVYNMPQDVQASGMMSHSVESGDDGKTSVRDRFNARQFMSWLQDVDDKFDKLKTCLLMRQQHEAAALNAVQRLEWQLKQQELDPALYKATSIFDISEFYIPLVEVNDDFDLTPI